MLLPSVAGLTLERRERRIPVAQARQVAARSWPLSRTDTGLRRRAVADQLSPSVERRSTHVRHVRTGGVEARPASCAVRQRMASATSPEFPRKAGPLVRRTAIGCQGGLGEARGRFTRPYGPVGRG